MTVQRRAAALEPYGFLGFPLADYEPGGREQFIYLLNEGLDVDSRVLDIGCGVLRAGYWLIHFLRPDRYCGIEPHATRLDLGRRLVLEPDELAAKRPRFDTNPRFDTSVFGETFDFFLAYSIWTHASKRQIAAMLDGFVRDAAPGGIFLTTYLPPDDDHPDYLGDGWVGTSHDSEVPGCICHSLDWIVEQCDRRDLQAEERGRDRTYGQSWLSISRRRPG